jgi:hypothetical protein
MGLDNVQDMHLCIRLQFVPVQIFLASDDECPSSGSILQQEADNQVVATGAQAILQAQKTYSMCDFRT